jgi:hypothetical protein
VIYLTTLNSLTWKDPSVLGPLFAYVDEDLGAGRNIWEIKTVLLGFIIYGSLGGQTLFAKAVGLALFASSGLSNYML